MKLSLLTLFPEYFDGFRQTSIIKRALENHLFEFETINYRDFSTNKHKHVDDTPYGGGMGMVLACEPIVKALESLEGDRHVVLLSPSGTPFDQKKAHELAEKDHVVLICGHYEGFDERIKQYVDEEISLGDFILTGGEPAAAAISDAVARLVPGVIKEESASEESFENDLLEYPQYTKPAVYDGHAVPEVLLSGHHENIRRWRLKQSLEKTLRQRPDLLDKHELNEEERKLLEEIRQDFGKQDEHGPKT